MAVYREACLSKVPADCEVYGLFGDLLPAALLEEGGELQWGRARQGKVPDFKFLLSTPEGPKPCLAELKVISAGKTWFPRGVAGKGTDRRAARLGAEYEAKLRRYDIQFHGAGRQGELQPGPLVARFRDLGGLDEGQLVAGPWGDLSPHFHKLLRAFAESRVAAMSRAQGWEAAWQGDGGGETGHECDCCEGQRPLFAGTAVSAGSRSRSSGQAAPGHLAPGGAAATRQAGV